MNNSKKIFVAHHCKNPKCDSIWIDEDLTNAKTRPPKWKYCKECCEKYGYINPKFPPKRKNAKERIQRLEKYKFKKENN